MFINCVINLNYETTCLETALILNILPLKSLLVILKSYSEIRFYCSLNFSHHGITISDHLTPLAGLPNHLTASTSSFYARGAHGTFVSTLGDPSLPGCAWPPRPGRAAPRLSQTPLIHHFPLPTFPLKKQPGVTSESAGQASQLLRSYS